MADPANSPIFAPDGLTGTARRAFNKVFVPYDAEKQNYAPAGGARRSRTPRPDSPKGTWSYVPIQIGTATRTIGVYLPPGYDPNRAEPYKTIYMQHGSGQDQSDWMNMGDVPVIMDNLLQDGTTEPAVVITTNTNYLGAAAPGYPNLRNIVIPFVESNYNVSTDAMDRAFAGLSAGAAVTQNLINFDATKFGYYGAWSGGVGVRNTTANIGSAVHPVRRRAMGLRAAEPEHGGRADQRVHRRTSWSPVRTTSTRGTSCSRPSRGTTCGSRRRSSWTRSTRSRRASRPRA